MSKYEAVPLWKCGECNTVHGCEDGARECCAPDVTEMWGCPLCEKDYESESKALHCCADSGDLTRRPCCARDYSEVEINCFAVRVAGHCTSCSPIFSSDQQFEIEDKLRKHTGRIERLNE